MSRKSPKRYGVLNTFCYIYKQLYNFDKKLISFQIAQVIFSTATPFLWVVLPAYVVGLLESKISLNIMILRLMAAFFGAGVISGIQTYLTKRNSLQYIEFRAAKCSADIWRKYLGMDYELCEKQSVNEMLSKSLECLSGNDFGIEGFIHKTRSLMTNMLCLMLYAGMITNIHPILMLFLTVTSVLQLCINQKAQKYSLKYRHEKAKIRVSQNYLNHEMNEVANGKDVRLYHLAPWLDGKYQALNKLMRGYVSKERKGFYLQDLCGLVFQFLRDALCYGYLLMLLKQGLSAAQFVLYLGVVGGFANWFQLIFDDVLAIQGATEMIGDYRDYMNLSNSGKHGEGIEIKESGNPLEIEFRNVTYCYDGTKTPVLHNICFHLKPGETVALVGVNGAGKSTLVKLLTGLYQPTSGDIFVNGINRKELDLDDYMKQISVVFQNPFLYSFTIGENVAPQVKEKRDEKRIQEAIKKAGLWEKINSLGKGTKTYLNKDIEDAGIKLSGGEQQKIMLARAIYKNSGMLILDEPTAAMDAIAESELYAQYDSVRNGKTSVFISHRLASTRFCDQILFLENGRIIEQGTHEQLMAAGGGYSKMFEVQSQYYREEENHEAKTVLEGCL